MTESRVSVVLPTWNRPERMLGAAIESVLCQDVPSLQLIVVDDGSDPPAAPVLRRFGDRIERVVQANAGIGAARNAGVARATGDYLAFIDSDDLWEPGKLERQLACLEADERLEAVFGRCVQFHDEEVDEAFRLRHPIQTVEVDGLMAGAMLIRRAAFHRVGPFDETNQTGVEIDWFLRATEAELRREILPVVVHRRRIHRSNLNTRVDGNRGRLLALKRGLDRRRPAG